jgi:hypothetical protein
MLYGGMGEEFGMFSHRGRTGRRNRSNEEWGIERRVIRRRHEQFNPLESKFVGASESQKD